MSGSLRRRPRLLATLVVVSLTTPGCRFNSDGVGLVDTRVATDGGPAETSADLSFNEARPPTDGPPREGSVVDGPLTDGLLGEGALGDGSALDGSTSPWWDANWPRRRKLWFNNTAGGEDLDLFVVLVELDAARIDYAATKKNGEDLRFVDADQLTVLPHEIERWQSGGLSHVWVRVPRIDKLSASDHIWLYYGHSKPPKPPVGAAEQVWLDAFAGVWHLGDFKDSASKLDAADHGSVTADGRVGAGRYFDGAAYLELPDDSALDLEELTVELWFRTKQTWDAPYWPGSAVLVTRATTGWGSGDWSILGGRGDADVGDVGRLLVGIGSDHGTSWEPRLASQSGLNDDVFHYVAWTRQLTGGSGENKLYIDGVEVSSVADSGKTIVADRKIQIGGDEEHSGGAYLEGVIDEVRISRLPRSAGWIAAQHASMSGKLVTYGAEESAP